MDLDEEAWWWHRQRGQGAQLGTSWTMSMLSMSMLMDKYDTQSMTMMSMSGDGVGKGGQGGQGGPSWTNNEKGNTRNLTRSKCNSEI